MACGPQIRRTHKFRARCETHSTRGCPQLTAGRKAANLATTTTTGDVPQGEWERGRQRRIGAEGSRKKEVIEDERCSWPAGGFACTPGLLEPTSCWTRVTRDGQGTAIGHFQWSKCSHRHRARKGRYPLACTSPCWKHKSHVEREYYAIVQCRRSFAVACNHYPSDIREKNGDCVSRDIFINNHIYLPYREISHDVPFTWGVSTRQIYLSRERLFRKAIWLRWPILASISERWNREWVEGAPRSIWMYTSSKKRVSGGATRVTHRLAALTSRSS